MSKYQIGRDISEIFTRLKVLENKLACCICGEVECVCGKSEKGELVIRCLTDEERDSLDRDKKRATIWCPYITMTACPPLGIQFGDTICVSPCPPCPDITSLRIVDAQGDTVCTMRVRWATAGHCSKCPPGGHRFIWV